MILQTSNVELQGNFKFQTQRSRSVHPFSHSALGNSAFNRSALRTPHSALRNGWLPDMDLNHDKQIQSLLCYRYTIGQTASTSLCSATGESRLEQFIVGVDASAEYPMTKEISNPAIVAGASVIGDSFVI